VLEVPVQAKRVQPMKPAIVVTGAASGIGRELARVAAPEGLAMVLVDRSQAALDELVAELGRSGAQAGGLCIDLAERDAGRRLENALAERGLYCDVLVNSAGLGLFGPVAEADREEQLRLLDVNMRALTELTLRFIPAMVARRHGGVLNVGSISGYMPGPNVALYSASKAYVRSFTAALGAELAGSGVTVTCLAPGIVRTALFLRTPLSQTRLNKLLPRADAPKVAAAGWRAFRAGKPLVIPGLANRIIVRVSGLLPDAALLRLISFLLRKR
jgi:short-subunit dehydrogenase